MSGNTNHFFSINATVHHSRPTVAHFGSQLFCQHSDFLVICLSALPHHQHPSGFSSWVAANIFQILYANQPVGKRTWDNVQLLHTRGQRGVFRCSRLTRQGKA